MTAQPATESGFLAPAERTRVPPRRRVLFALLVLALVTLISSPLFNNAIPSGGPRAQGGVLTWPAGSAQPIHLQGNWSIYWGGIGPETRATPSLSADVPGSWD